MACDFLCIGLFPEPALVLSFNLHLNEPLVANFLNQYNNDDWKIENSFEKGGLQIGHIIPAARWRNLYTGVFIT